MTSTKKRRKWPIVLLAVAVFLFAKTMMEEESETPYSPSASYAESSAFSQEDLTYSDHWEHSDTSNDVSRPAYSEVPSADESVPESRIPAEWREHLYLNSVGTGHCQELCGNVLITFVFTDDAESTWTDSAKADAQTALMSEMQELLTYAESFGIDLSLYYLYYDADISVVAEQGEGDWKDEAILDLGYSSLQDAQTELALLENATSAPIVFVFNKDGRAYANWGFGVNSAESVVLYASDTEAFRHELFHLYGARDFYYPSVVTDAAENHLTDSIMNNGETTDDLTAFMIGWTDTLSANAESFLHATASLTQEYLDSESDKNQLTGFGTKEFASGVYEGYMEFGVCHGQGTLSYYNGDKYVGNFENGYFQGYGEYTWANGNVLKINFTKGHANGGGTLLYHNGDRYVGNFQNWTMHGYGEYTWANGVVYKGNYVNGSANGKGKMIWTDGSYYDGDFADGQRHGNGTYVWTNGNYYTGAWENGNRHGYGVMVYADGTKQEGMWENGIFVG